MERVGEIPLVTEDTWSGVAEKSHAPLHPFYPGEKWRGEVTKVALVRDKFSIHFFYSFRYDRYFVVFLDRVSHR